VFYDAGTLISIAASALRLGVLGLPDIRRAATARSISCETPLASLMLEAGSVRSLPSGAGGAAMRAPRSAYLKSGRWRRGLALTAVVAVVVAMWGARNTAQHMGASQHTVVGNAFAFRPSRIVVNAGDAVTVRVIARDRPYTFTIDAYRISRRATPGKDAVVEFCADQPGRFVYYCSLSDDVRCRDMKGELVVR
jgi:plastocyanin